MKQVHIYIYGYIVNDQVKGDWANDMGIVNLKSVVEVLNQNPDVEEIVLHIHSRGGDVNEGFAIFDVLKATGKKVKSVIEGLCASIATVVALAGEEREMTPNSEFFIHNPWGDPWNMSGFTADDYQKRADEIKAAETKLLDFYREQTGLSKKALSEMMAQETTLTAEEALEMKFITKISEPLKAFATLSTHNNMNKFQMAIKALKNVIDSATQNLTVTTADNKSLVIDGDKIEAGKSVTMDGKEAPNGDYLMPDKSTIVIEAGKIKEIKNAPAAVENKELENLKSENATLKARITELENGEKEGLKALTEITKHLETLNSIGAPAGKTTPPATPPATPAASASVEERAKAAIERSKKRREEAAKK